MAGSCKEILLLTITTALLIGVLHHKLPVRHERYYDLCDVHYNRTYNFDDTSLKGPKRWHETHPRCKGTEQSPIDIVTKDVRCDNRLTDFNYTGYDTVPTMPFLIKSFDDSWQVAVFEYEGSDIFIKGAWLPKRFSLFSIFFWAGPGSMHKVDGTEYSLQLGLFHWHSQKYRSFFEAVNKADGVVILSVFVQADDERSMDPQNQAFSEAFDNVIEGAKEDVSWNLSFPISSLLPKNRVYYKYHGSYYAPPCHESIIFLVYEQPLYITQDQLERFREVFSESSEPATNNGRPTQPLNGRVVSKLC